MTAKKAEPANEDTFQYEEALKQLEHIVHELEHGDLTLEASIKKYEEGMQLSQQLTKGLEAAQKRVDVLMKNTAGELAAEPFDVRTDDAS